MKYQWLYLLAFLVMFWACKPKTADQQGILFPIKENGKWGYMNAQNEVVVKAEFDMTFPFSAGMGRILKDNLYGFVDSTGKVVVSPALFYAEDFSEELAIINKKPLKPEDGRTADYTDIRENWSYINKQGFIYPNDFRQAKKMQEAWAAVELEENVWTFVRVEGNDLRMMDKTFAAGGIGNFKDGVAPVIIDGVVKAVDKEGKVVIDEPFNIMYDFSEGLSVSQQGDKIGYIDTNGKWVYEKSVSFDKIQAHDFGKFSNGLAWVRIAAERCIFINKEGKQAFKKEFVYAYDFKNGLAQVYVGGATWLIDSKGETAFQMPKEAYALLDWNEKVAIMNTSKGMVVVELASKKTIAEGYDQISIVGDWLKVQQDGNLYGFIDTKGKFVIEPKYYSAESFTQGEAKVRIKDTYFGIDKTGKELPRSKTNTTEEQIYVWQEEGKYGFRKGETVLVPTQFDYAENPEGDVARVNKGAKVFTSEEFPMENYKGGKWALIDLKGKPKTDFKYALIKPFENEKAWFNEGGEGTVTNYFYDHETEGETQAYTCEGGKWGLMDTNGKELIQARFDDFQSNSKVLGKYLIKENGKWGMVNLQADYLLEPEYDSLAFSKNRIKFWLGKNVGLMDIEGKILLQARFEDLMPKMNDLGEWTASEGLFLMKQNGKYGFVDEKDSIRIEAEYEEAEDFSEGLAKVKKNDKYGFVDRNGTLVIPCQYNWADNFKEGIAAARIDQGGDQGLINQKGEFVVGVQNAYYEPAQNGLVKYYSYANDGMEAGILTTSGKVVFDKKSFNEVKIQSNGLIYVKKGERWAIADRTGRMISGFDYSYIEPFDGQELIRVNKGGAVYGGEGRLDEYVEGGFWGAVDQSGNLRIALQYPDLGRFGEGLAPARSNQDLSEVGYIDFSGRWIRKLTK